MTKIRGYFIVLTLAVFVVAGCSSLTITEVTYTQPIEMVLKPNTNGVVSDVRTGFSLNVSQLNEEEAKKGDRVTPDLFRIIQNNQGMYFITADGYKNVYVMQPTEKGLKLVKAIEIAGGVVKPAFNQRNPNIELISDGKSYKLTKDGVN